MDKRSILLLPTPQIKRFGAAVLLFLVAACAATPQEADTPSGEPDAVDVPDVPDVPRTQAPATLSERLGDEIDPDVLFHVLAAERLIGMGQYHDAMEQYLDAALLSEQPELARQVTRLAAQMGEWPMALAGAERWLELEPDSDQARQMRILAWINSGQIERAVGALAEMVEHGDDSQQGWRQAAMLIGSVDDNEVAMEVMSRLIEHQGRDAYSPDIMHIQSLLLWQIGDAEAALSTALDAAEGSGERKHLTWAAQLAVSNERLTVALDLYRRVRRDAPEDVPLGLAEAEVLNQLERRDEALEVLHALPQDKEVLYTTVIYLIEADQFEPAAQVWDRLAGLQVEEDEALPHAYMVARTAELLERDAEAIAWYKRVDSGLNQNQALLRRAILEGQAGRMMEARNLLRAVRMGSDRRMADQSWQIEAELLREAGMAEEAVQLMGTALRESPNSIRLLYTRALSAVAADDLELAEQDLRRIIQLDGDNAMALNALGYTLTDRTDRHQEAYRLIRSAHELEPDDPAILDSMGWVYFRLGQPEKALPYLQRALEGEDNPEIAAHVIEVLWHLERFDEARELVEHALEHYPDDDILTDTLQRLNLSE